MCPDKTGRELHDRATRGETLSTEERSLLEQWYAGRDQAEMAELRVAAGAADLGGLRAEVDAVLAQLAGVTRRMQEIAAENAALRDENANLLGRLAQRSLEKPA